MVRFRNILSGRTNVTLLKSPVEVILCVFFTLIGIGLIIFDDRIGLHPFRITLEDEKLYSSFRERYSDINNDGTLERIEFNIYGDFINIEIFNENNDFINQVTLDGNWLSRGQFFVIGDYNYDTLKEIYAVAISNDSLMLYAMSFEQDESIGVESELICKVSSHNGQYDISAGNLKLADFDGSGENEVFFSLFSGFSLTPRKLYIYHPENHNLISSKDIGVKYTEASFFDINGDGSLEILAGSYSSENYDTLSPIEFGDRKAGTFIYNSDLEILSNPIIFEENKPTVNFFPLEREKDTMIIAVVNETRCMNNSRILFLNKSMDIVNEISMPQMLSPGLFRFQEKGQTLYYLSDEYSIFLLDHLNFNTIPVRLKGEIFDMVDGSKGIGSKYLLFSTLSGIALVNSNLKLASNKIAVAPNFSVVEKIFDDYSGDMRYILYNDNFKKYYTLRFTYRKIYDYRYLLYLVSLIFIYLVIFIIGSEIRVKSAMRRLIEQRSSILELQLMHTQLQPHFTFNILNTLGSMIYHDNKEEAYTYLHKFSSLLRMVLETDVDLKWTLNDEISFVEQYISLENERFQGKYNYKFIINDNVERSFLVPKMIMQVFVENALSHGLRTKQSDCYVVITISLSDSHLKIDIADNGIGRKKASSLKANRKGKSIVLINEFINSYNRNNKSKFGLRIFDFQPEQSETGTRVEIDIPVEFCKHKK